jgi:hypothetical protein
MSARRTPPAPLPTDIDPAAYRIMLEKYVQRMRPDVRARALAGPMKGNRPARELRRKAIAAVRRAGLVVSKGAP